MANEYGSNYAGSETGDESPNGKSQPITEAASVPLAVGSFSIDDAIAMHLVDCDQCRTAIQNLRPVALGQNSGHCGDYWQMQLMRARYEGRANNIVAYTEYGDQARKGGPLE